MYSYEYIKQVVYLYMYIYVCMCIMYTYTKKDSRRFVRYNDQNIHFSRVGTTGKQQNK